jgi:hypothetical protein
MKAAVLERIRQLGGDTSRVEAGASLKDQLAAIRFSQVLFDEDWECYGVDEFRAANQDLYARDRQAFLEALLDHLLAENDEPRKQHFWRNEHFTPMTEGTPDHDAWIEFFRDLDLAEIREVVGMGQLEFVQIMYYYGYPDHYFVCLADPNPENPIVFGTDHEVFFEEASSNGSLEDFLNRFLTRDQLRTVVANYLFGN